MNGQPSQQPELKQIEAKDELEKQRIQLHNAKFQVQMIEALVKKLEELSR